MKRIMIVDDEKNVLQSLQRALRKPAQEAEFSLELHTSPNEASKRLDEAQFYVVISDYHMPEMSGVDFLKLVKAKQPDAIRIMLSASAEFKTVLGAINDAEVFRYIEKPWDVTTLEQTIRLALSDYEQSQAQQILVDEVKAKKNQLSAQELEKKRLEKEEPGITKVNWGPDGEVILDDV